MANQLVTVDLGEENSASNTFVVVRKLEGESLVSHPLAPECHLLYDDKFLNNVPSNLPNATERCLSFAAANRQYLSYAAGCDLEALTFYFIIRKSFSTKQLSDIAQICGTIAAILLSNSLDRAARVVNDNTPLLDDFNMLWYNNYQKIFEDVRKINSKNQSVTIFNMAGFVLAQTYKRG